MPVADTAYCATLLCSAELAERVTGSTIDTGAPRSSRRVASKGAATSELPTAYTRWPPTPPGDSGAVARYRAALPPRITMWRSPDANDWTMICASSHRLAPDPVASA